MASARTQLVRLHSSAHNSQITIGADLWQKTSLQTQLLEAVHFLH